MEQESWGTDKVAKWIAEQGFEEYSSNFTSEKIDGKVLLTLSGSFLLFFSI